MNSIAERAKHLVNLDFYENINSPEEVAKFDLECPYERQYILRCPIKVPGKRFAIPDEMLWTVPLIEEAIKYQENNVGKLSYWWPPYIYLTIRHGLVTSETDDEWHVDGFSMKISHVPEQNYIWVSNNPTEYVEHGLRIPIDFDPMNHNIHYYIQDHLSSDVEVKTIREKTLYAMDPYVIHRRPKLDKNISRTFIRLSFTAIPIDDKNNHINPRYGNICSDNDGVVDFRDKLTRYKEK